MDTSTYYVGRVVKMGMIDSEKLHNSLLSSKQIINTKTGWSIINSKECLYKDIKEKSYIFGTLCKFALQQNIAILDREKNEPTFKEEKNTILASSNFIYIPEFSGIAFQHVSRHIEIKHFQDNFRKIINETNGNLFVDCTIEMIQDMRLFAQKLKGLNVIYKLESEVSPPNPLFGPLWKSLKEYLEKRNLDRLKITEENITEDGIITNIKELVEEVEKEQPNADNVLIAPIDAAVLMSADGYGQSKIYGSQDNQSVVINTSETNKNFSFSKEPETDALYEKVYKILEEIKNKRHMEH